MNANKWPSGMITQIIPASLHAYASVCDEALVYKQVAMLGQPSHQPCISEHLLINLDKTGMWIEGNPLVLF